MGAVPSIHTPGKRGLLDVLRSWLQAQPSDIWESPDLIPSRTENAGERPLGTPVVLVVDDNPVNLMVMSTMLESRGLVPIVAADGAEAVALASELHLDLILMDLQMPILDGLGATSAIRRFETDSSLPAVPVLAYSSSTLAEADLAAHGLSGSLAKPCGAQELDDCLIRWCPTYSPAQATLGITHVNGRNQRGRAPDASAARSC